MRDFEVAPDPRLMESMRAVGYTLETAIADIVDNSITAGAGEVDVRFSANPEPRIAVIDNGSGMDEETLLLAMRLAGRPPSAGRHAHDLGRFGLGLKTASLSQARSLTVVTKQGSLLRGVRWDLDHLAKTGRWSLQILGDDELISVPWIERLEARGSGTLVLWERMDQLHTDRELAEETLDELMKVVRGHLGLVFHRFTNSAMPPLTAPLQLRINGAVVPKVDPFLRHHKGRQELSPEVVRLDGSEVLVQPYVLPHIGKLKASDRQMALVAGTLRDSQGFYIYRAGRLVLWGTWFRILPRDELGKLARVQVDVPNALDHLWQLDIKKSAATPPPEVRRRLAQIAGKIVRSSHRVHTFRGRKSGTDRIDRLWSLIEDRGTFRYELNRDHPLVLALSGSLDDRGRASLAQVLRAIEATFPVEDAYNRLGGDHSHNPPTVEPTELAELARALVSAMGVSVEVAAERLAFTEPFNNIADLESFLREVTGA